MRNIQFDWRWVVLIAIVLILVYAPQLPWQVTAVVLGAGGAYVLRMGWRIWKRAGGPPSRSRVTYWRGERIEIGPQRRGPALPRLNDIGPAAVYLLIGGVMVIAAASLVLNSLGF